MKKYKDYYYSVKHIGFIERNCFAAIKTYSYSIYSKGKKMIIYNLEEFQDKESAEFAAKLKIDNL